MNGEKLTEPKPQEISKVERKHIDSEQEMLISNSTKKEENNKVKDVNSTEETLNLIEL